jgi:hypothetical protein
MTTNNNLCDYLLRIDGPSFRRQRLWLLEMADRLPEKDRNTLDGVVCLLDEIADQAHDRHGVDCLLTEEPPQVEAVVIRRSHDENTCAVLKCDRTDRIPNAAAFRDALKKAVSDWADRTTDGHEAYAENDNDFNLGDLARRDGDPTLLKFMQLHGIIGFTIQVFCDNTPAHGWTFDDNLVDEEGVNGLDAADGKQGV